MPYQEAPDPPVDAELRAACAEALHVIAPDGSVTVGADAVLEVYRLLGWRSAGVAALPPFVWGARLGYGVVARNRHLFSRWLFTDDPGG